MAATLAAPMLALWCDPLVATAFLLPVYIVSDAAAVRLYRRDFTLINVELLIARVLLVGALATLLAPAIPVSALTFATGLIGLASCLRFWLSHRPPSRAPHPSPPESSWTCLTGIISFVSHSGGPPIQA
ncbi:MAG: TSUP family transporter [Rhizobiaceae bacterium]